MNLLTVTLLAALSWYRMTDGTYRQLDDKTSLPGKLKAVKVDGEWQSTTNDETHIICDRTTDPVKAKFYEFAWRLAAKCQEYQLDPNGTKGDAIDRMAWLEASETNATIKEGIQIDNRWMDTTEGWLTRNAPAGQTWQYWLARYETEERKVTKWEPVK